MRRPAAFFLFPFLLGTALSFATRYDGYQMLEVTVSNQLQAQRLADAETTLNLDVVWLAGSKAHVMVAPGDSATMRHVLGATGMTYTVVQDDVQNDIDENMDMIARRRHDFGTFNYDYYNYNNFTTVMEELEQLAADCPSGISCEVVQIGSSYNGEPLKLLRIGSGDRQAYWLDSTMHAREWLSTTTLMWITQTLIREYNSNADAQRLVDTYDWYIVPVMNPDGYIYTWTGDRLWRKTRSPNEGTACLGTDLDRNYDFLWADPITGNLVDYAKAVAGVKYTYMAEIPTSSGIISAYELMWRSLVDMVEAIESRSE